MTPAPDNQQAACNPCDKIPAEDGRNLCTSCQEEIYSPRHHSHILYTAPIRKKKPFLKGCLMGLLLFSPTIILTFIFLNFYFQQREQVERQELETHQPTLETPQAANQPSVEEFKKLQQTPYLQLITQLNRDPHSLVLTIFISNRWRQLSCEERRKICRLWLDQWRYLGGHSILVLDPGTQTRLAIVDPQSKEITIPGCQ